MFKLDLAEEATKLAGTTAKDTAWLLGFKDLYSQEKFVNSAGQAVQKVLEQVTEAGQKAVDDVCKTAQEAGEKANQGLTTQVNAWGKSFNQSEEKKNVPT